MAATSFFEQYRKDACEQIQAALDQKNCQPILFVGSGISRRYFDAPNWPDLLKKIIEFMDDGGYEYEYYHQKYDGSTIAIGSALSERVMEWAWKAGRKKLPEHLFKTAANGDIFIKHIAATVISDITPELAELKKKNAWPEIEILLRVRPHAIITTNYDNFLETVFEGYEVIVGQNVLTYNLNSFGEIFKIHGSVDDSNTLVLTGRDYESFIEEKIYVSSKLLTYFTEHPVFVFGYGFNDPNVASIIADVGRIVADQDGLIQNIFYVEWDKDAETKTSLPTERLITFGEKQFRVRSIVTSDFGWVFQALAVDPALKSINTKLVRSLAARVYSLIRTDIPKGKVEVDYKVLKGLTENAEDLPKLLGITPTGNPVHTHPFNLSEIGIKLGYSSWHGANDLIAKVKDKTGVDIKASDNNYHCKVQNGTSHIRKWSQSSYELLKKVRDGEPYSLSM